IHHLWPVAKADRRIDEPAEPHHADHFIEIADGDLDLRQKIDGAGAGRFLSVVDRNRAAKLTLGDELAVAVKTDLARDGKKIAGAHEGNIVGDRSGRLWQADTKLLQFLFDSPGHS